MGNIIVSICCITYNHEKYIEKTLDGFLMQEVDFPYEVLIHDDASTDNTQRIIQEYQVKYPNIIKPIFQVDNQYSKNIKINFTYNFPRAKGKYIAMCEGDDYWIDKFKLQKQVEYMESNPGCSLTTHAATIISEFGEVKKTIVPSFSNRIFTIEEIINGGGGLFPTNSMIFRSEFVKELPQFMYEVPVGDYPLTIHLASKGDVYFINDKMSVYTYMGENSWSMRMSRDTSLAVEYYRKSIDMMLKIDSHLLYEYTNLIKMRIIKYEFSIICLTGDTEKLKLEKFNSLYNELNFKDKIKIYAIKCFPNIIRVYKSLRYNSVNVGRKMKKR